MKRHHELPFGAEIVADGVRFRLWAPAENAVDVLVGGNAVAMTAAGDGWHEAVTSLARPGDSYAFRLDDGTEIADPASRAQVRDLEGRSVLVDPAAYAWRETGWKGRPWEEAIVYELHVGTFTQEGTFRAAIDRLPALLTMERLLFRLIAFGFSLLTLTVLSGIVFSEQLFGMAFRWDHKTVFTLLSWMLFGSLLAGRVWRGWRGKTALRFTLTGFATLLLAYVGSRFVLEVVLHRSIV